MSTRSRIYSRQQGKKGKKRHYGDFRDFRDVGGGQEALIPAGQRTATTDPLIAENLAADRLREYQERRRNKTILGVERQATLGEFASHHLVEMAKAGRVQERWISAIEQRLRVAIEVFGADRDLIQISVRDVATFRDHVRQCAGRGENEASDQTVRHYLNALSKLYQRAISENYVAPGHNPVAGLMDKPTGSPTEAQWLEVPEASLFLEVCRRYEPARPEMANDFLYEVVATLLLTGGRKMEVLGLQREDVSFERETVTFRPNRWRDLKTATSQRVVKLWPQLRDVLRAHVDANAIKDDKSLLFPSARADEEQPITDLRKTFDSVGETIGWKQGRIRTRIFRHTYCAARLQTLDNGEAVSVWTVARELGHSSVSMVEGVYGHLGTIQGRQRGTEVSFCFEDHACALEGSFHQ